MTKVNEIKEAIRSLPEEDFARLRHWFSEKDWEKWDGEIEADSEAGKVDFLIQEAKEEKEQGKLKDSPRGRDGAGQTAARNEGSSSTRSTQAAQRTGGRRPSSVGAMD